MPIYEFECKDCNEQFEDLVSMSLCETCPDTVCPKCESKNWTKLVSKSSFNFTNPVGTDRWNNSHDYRFNHNIPSVKKERETAEKFSHMGATPYVDNSEEDFKLDTGIHDAETIKGLS